MSNESGKTPVTVWVVATRGMEDADAASEAGKTKLGPHEALMVKVEDFNALTQQLAQLQERYEQEWQDRVQAQVAEERFRSENEALLAREKLLESALEDLLHAVTGDVGAMATVEAVQRARVLLRPSGGEGEKNATTHNPS